MSELFKVMYVFVVNNCGLLCFPTFGFFNIMQNLLWGLIINWKLWSLQKVVIYFQMVLSLLSDQNCPFDLNFCVIISFV